MSEPSKTRYLVGNWKMNGIRSDIAKCIEIADAAQDLAPVELAICPPPLMVSEVAHYLQDKILKVGAQDCHEQEKGAHTGDISAAMIRDAGASFVIVGHSERRRDHYETSSQVARKVAAAIDEGLVPIVCVGEFLEKRETGGAIQYVVNQLTRSLPSRPLTADSLMIAYEPIWAIGTGRTANPEDIAEMHLAIRQALVTRFGEEGNAIPLLYGGSVTADKADILMIENVNGALIGGASLKPESFLAIARNYLELAGA